MRPVAHLLEGTLDVTVRVTRRSQARAIAALDRLATRPGTSSPRLLGRLWGFQLDVTGILVDEPLELWDLTYDAGGRLLALHREFLHRIVEAMDPREPPARGRPPVAEVVPISLYR